VPYIHTQFITRCRTSAGLGSISNFVLMLRHTEIFDWTAQGWVESGCCWPVLREYYTNSIAQSRCYNNNNNNNNNNNLFTAIGLSAGGSGYFTCKQNMKLVTTRFKSGGLPEKHVVATWNVGNHLSICLKTQGNQEKSVSRWPVAGPSEYWLLASSPASKVKTAMHTRSTTNTHKMTTIHTRQLQQYT